MSLQSSSSRLGVSFLNGVSIGEVIGELGPHFVRAKTRARCHIKRVCATAGPQCSLCRALPKRLTSAGESRRRGRLEMLDVAAQLLDRVSIEHLHPACAFGPAGMAQGISHQATSASEPCVTVLAPMLIGRLALPDLSFDCSWSACPARHRIDRPPHRPPRCPHIARTPPRLD